MSEEQDRKLAEISEELAEHLDSQGAWSPDWLLNLDPLLGIANDPRCRETELARLKGDLAHERYLRRETEKNLRTTRLSLLAVATLLLLLLLAQECPAHAQQQHLLTPAETGEYCTSYSSKDITCSFPTPGIWRVTHTVCNEAGCDSITKWMTVLDPAPTIERVIPSMALAGNCAAATTGGTLHSLTTPAYYVPGDVLMTMTGIFACTRIVPGGCQTGEGTFDQRVQWDFTADGIPEAVAEVVCIEVSSSRPFQMRSCCGPLAVNPGECLDWIPGLATFEPGSLSLQWVDLQGIYLAYACEEIVAGGLGYVNVWPGAHVTLGAPRVVLDDGVGIMGDLRIKW